MNLSSRSLKMFPSQIVHWSPLASVSVSCSNTRALKPNFNSGRQQSAKSSPVLELFCPIWLSWATYPSAFAHTKCETQIYSQYHTLGLVGQYHTLVNLDIRSAFTNAVALHLLQPGKMAPLSAAFCCCSRSGRRL